MYRIFETKRYRKDLRRAEKRGCDIGKLDSIIKRIAAGEDLPQSRRVHTLKGTYFGYEECHIESDWLLIYKRENHQLILVLFRTGTHADLFDE